MIRSYRDLEVWKLGLELVEKVYNVTRSFPDVEKFGLASQLRRGAISVPSNIAEGKMRYHLKDYVRFLSIAQGSLGEIDTQIEIACRLSYISRQLADELQTQVSILAKRLRRLRQSLLESAGG